MKSRRGLPGSRRGDRRSTRARARRWHDLAHPDESLNREVFLAFWKVHILHHASQAPVYGQEIIRELRQHGYDISPGTVYPILRRMRENGWLRGARAGVHGHERRDYTITAKGRGVLDAIRRQVEELYGELD